MKNNRHPVSLWLSRTFAGAITVMLIAFGMLTYAQSVEKAETSQQAREADSELERAKAIVTKPKDNKAVKPETGRTWGVYSTTSSLELGYRFVDPSGSIARYLSDVNVRDGFRVLESSMDLRAQPGTGVLFDYLHADVNNAGGDQAQTFALRMDKTKWYRFDSNVRRFNYFRSLGPNFALGLRDYDLRQQVSDFNLKLLPQRAVRFNLGYGRSMAKGRYTPTYYSQSDIFQLLGNTRWEANDYRAGIDATYRKWNFNLEQLYREFRNNPELTGKPGGDLGYYPDPKLPATNGSLATLTRLTPLRSHAMVTRASITGAVTDDLHVVFRALHDAERMTGQYFEAITATSATGLPVTATIQFPNQGASIKRPNDKVDAAVSYDLGEHVTISDTFSYTAFKILGYGEILTTTLTKQTSGATTTSISDVIAKDYVTDLTSYSNTLELGLTFTRKFSANLGWRAMHRDVSLLGTRLTVTSPLSASNPAIKSEEEAIGTNAFIGGMRFRPTKRTSFMFDVEKGENNNAFVRINPLDYTRFRVRAQVQANDKLQFSGAFTSMDKTNPTPQVNNDSNMRSYSVAVSYEPKQRVMIDMGYDYHDLNARGGIVYRIPINGVTTQVTGNSYYYARINSFYANTRFGLTNRLDLLMAYYYIMDRGAPSISLGVNDFANSYPLKRHNPEARLAYRFTNNVTGNLSYRHYSYNERDFSVQDYRSNILTTSLRFTF
ncbi:MAG TPA: hypothetical protein PLK30_03420 [Blastocatellia bacterium]|nr:hypothetical protein [Blastocatellia bacterium]